MIFPSGCGCALLSESEEREMRGPDQNKLPAWPCCRFATLTHPIKTREPFIVSNNNAPLSTVAQYLHLCEKGGLFFFGLQNIHLRTTKEFFYDGKVSRSFFLFLPDENA
ncbi:hypothetical protein TNIN_232441 [Trichonephila inaurata madagascariensis]|uniref:Uncharacterized protein n=1 Tax=Trichonephila inaurata madagascariensis TaxID=2747483 RepID=A0A8X6YA76_9ARAC|nr:hypothetical protein TNIN_232441 [Trichonephila inaurata madagascariensis]